MGLEVVVNEILSRGSQEEQTLLRDAETERRRALDQAEGEADELRARLLQDTRTKIDALRREVMSGSEFEVRRRLLVAQRELADDFRRRVLDALSKLPKTETEKLFGVLAKAAQRVIPTGRVHAKKDHLPFLTNAGGYEKGAELAGAGGFQVESPDGSILLDFRYETLLDNAWKAILAEHRALFEG